MQYRPVSVSALFLESMEGENRMMSMNIPKIDHVMVGEALVSEGRLNHGATGQRSRNYLLQYTDQSKTWRQCLLVLVAPNLMARPATVIFNKVEIKNGQQAEQMFGPAQRGVATAVVDSVKEGVIPIAEAKDIFICIGVFIHWNASNKAKIPDWNYEATKLAIQRAVEGFPLPEEVIAQEKEQHHPLAVHD